MENNSGKDFASILELKAQCTENNARSGLGFQDYNDEIAKFTPLIGQCTTEESAESEGSDDCLEKCTYSNEISSIKDLNEFEYRQQNSDITSSVSFLGKRITRQYASEFILPDDTRIAINRRETINPVDNMEQVWLNLAVGFREYPSFKKYTFTELPSSSGTMKECNSTTDYNQMTDVDLIHTSNFEALQQGLQIIDYLSDDLWAETILTCDNSANGDLLRQLEVGCRLEPNAYRMERVQTVKNRETVIDFHNQPIIRTIGVSPCTSETGSINTVMTGLDAGDE